MQSPAEYAREIATRAKAASSEIAIASGALKNEWLLQSARLVRSNGVDILEANARDVKRAQSEGRPKAFVERLLLNQDRLDGIAKTLECVADLDEPVGEITEGHTRDDGLSVSRVRVPLGVAFIVYESRPSVTVDAAAICIKSGNATILRGGKEASQTNQQLHRALVTALEDVGLPKNAVQFVDRQDHDLIDEFLELNDLIDVAIPRGRRELIDRVTGRAKMHVIRHREGICHVYVDSKVDPEMAVNIVMNSKCQRPGVCNAAEALLVHEDIAESWLPRLAAALQPKRVELRCCQRSINLIPGGLPATDHDFHTEYLDLILSVKVVSDLNAAIDHINEYGTGHTDAIVTTDQANSREFEKRVDSSAVMVNASTRFNDGAELGLGAEIGISTDKIHARGPCGLHEMMSYKYLVRGSGHIRV